MGQLLSLASQTAVDRAWAEYAEHRAQALDDPRLETDRAWMQRRAILQRRFDRLFLMQERQS